MLKFVIAIAAAIAFVIGAANAHAQTTTYQVDLSGNFPNCPTRFTNDDAFQHHRFTCADGSIIGFVDTQNGNTTVIKLARLSEQTQATMYSQGPNPLMVFGVGVLVGTIVHHDRGYYYPNDYGREAWRDHTRRHY